MNGHDRIREAIAVYALDGQDEADRGRVERELLEHLPGCAECAAALREYREIAGDLALTAPPVAPSSELEARLMAAVRGESHGAAAAPVVRRPRRLVARVAVAAATVALVGSAALNVALVRRISAADRDRAAVTALVRTASDPRSTSVALRGRSGAVSLVYHPQGTAVLVAESLPAPPSGHVYELWYLDEAAVPVRTFVPEDGRVLLSLPRNPHAYRGAAITIEKSFVREPTTDPVYAATLDA